MDWRYDSRSRGPALQVRSPEFKPQSPPLPPKEKTQPHGDSVGGTSKMRRGVMQEGAYD
jgi:hypothetical protein